MPFLRVHEMRIARPLGGIFLKSDFGVFQISPASGGIKCAEAVCPTLQYWLYHCRYYPRRFDSP